MDKYSIYSELSTQALKSKVHDIRTQVDLGLISRKDAHDEINLISAILMNRAVAEATREKGDDEIEEYED